MFFPFYLISTIYLIKLFENSLFISEIIKYSNINEWINYRKLQN